MERVLVLRFWQSGALLRFALRDSSGPDVDRLRVGRGHATGDGLVREIRTRIGQGLRGKWDTTRAVLLLASF